MHNIKQNKQRNFVANDVSSMQRDNGFIPYMIVLWFREKRLISKNIDFNHNWKTF